MLLPSISLHIHDYSYHSYPYCRQMCVGRCVPSLICSQCVALVPCCPGVQEHVKADAEVSLEAVRRVPELHLGRSQQITLTAGMAGCSRMQECLGIVWDSLRFLDIPFPMRNKLAIQVAAVAQKSAPWPLPKIVILVAFHVA